MILTSAIKCRISPTGGGMCMKGGIYADEKCQICGGTLKDTGRFLACTKHPKCRATRYKVIFGAITKRFKSYDDADRFLTGIRFKTDENTFDERDYRKGNPLGFSNMAQKWLSFHAEEVRPGSRKNLVSHIRHAEGFFGNMNVKDIRYGNLEDFIHSLSLSGKSKHNILSTIHSLFAWMKKRQEISELPDFPEISFELGYRRTVDKETQQAIIEEVGRICSNRRVYLGIKWLATYISLRPGELIKLTEGNIDTGNGYLYIPASDSKTEYKAIPLIPEDVEILKAIPLTFPATPFFRHGAGIKGVADNAPFGIKYFYKWWVKACSNLGIDGVDLYGGTRHSSVRALRKYRSPEEIKRAAMSETNKAFERYMGKDTDDDLRSVYTQSAKVISLDKIDKELTMAKTT
jgi:integrase